MSTPTLDPERTDQMRTFLVVEAASSVADGSTARRPVPLRRNVVAGGVAAALLIGGVALAAGDDPSAPPVDAASGSAPASGPESSPGDTVDIADLRTISVTTEAGWTSVTLEDVYADPAAVVADLQAAGFDAVASEVSASSTWGLSRLVVDGEELAAPAFGVLNVDAGPRGMTGLLVLIEGEGAELANQIPLEDVYDGEVEISSGTGDAAVRFGLDGSPDVSIREGSEGITIVVARPLVEPQG